MLELEVRQSRMTANPGEPRYINYLEFIKDYDMIENQGLGAGNNALMFGNKFMKRDISLRQ